MKHKPSCLLEPKISYDGQVQGANDPPNIFISEITSAKNYFAREIIIEKRYPIAMWRQKIPSNKREIDVKMSVILNSYFNKNI